jgi:hypothetical protein
MPVLPLASGFPGSMGVLIFFIIVLLVIGLSAAQTFGQIAMVLAAIAKLLRDSKVSNAAMTMSPPGITMPPVSESQVVVLPGLGGFGQALGAGLQQSVGQQLGQQLGQMFAAAAAQHPLAFQVTPIVMVIEAARRQGDMARIRPFLTDRFAPRFPIATPAGIAHIALANADAPAHGDQVVVRIDRNAGVTVHSEYWSFQKAPSVLPGTPEKCPQCGAPTAGDDSGACRFCGAVFATPTGLPQPTRWLLDDISNTPPALAA